MAMKTIHKKAVKNSYPKIMKSDMYIILFSKAGEGVVLEALSGLCNQVVGEVRTHITMSCYVDHNEPVTIQNAKG